MGDYNAIDRKKQVKWEAQKELANFAVEYKKQNRKRELEENKKVLFWAYGPSVMILLFIVIMIMTLVWASNNDWKFYLMVPLLLISTIVASAISLISTIRFMMYACDNPKLSVFQKIIWVIAFFYFNLFIFPLYFHEHILYKNLDAEKERLLCAWEEDNEEIV